MVWRRIFHRDPEPDETQPPGSSDSDDPAAHSTQMSENPPTSDSPPASRVPLHMQQAISQRSRPGQDDPEARLATLRRRRTAALYDVEQGELARAKDNPWKQRAALLTESLETVENDRAAALSAEREPYHPVEPMPIRNPQVRFADDVATVSFEIGDQLFAFEEIVDWAERGHQVVRGDITRTSGETSGLLPDNVPESFRDPLQAHLDLSLFVLATNLRDRTLNDEPMPADLTLADLAKPCPECGGWSDFLGRCQACARRAARVQRLDAERNRLLSERAEELEEEHRTAERLAIAMRRLADIDTEIAALEKYTS